MIHLAFFFYNPAERGNFAKNINLEDLKELLERKTLEYNQPSFIDPDPVSIPHSFKKKQDIEISAFFAAIFAWGNRNTIIRKGKELMNLMDSSPHQFCLGHSSRDLKTLENFRHRTFNATDLLYFIEFFRFHYNHHTSLEFAFTKGMKRGDENTENALIGFHRYFFSLEEIPSRRKKHISSPQSGSTCKRLNMFLRWMVRKDKNGVDFGIWDMIRPSQLICPVDLHVARVSRKLGLLSRKQTDWKAALELTASLRKFDREDPVKYDLALFGMGVMEKFR